MTMVHSDYAHQVAGPQGGIADDAADAAAADVGSFSRPSGGPTSSSSSSSYRFRPVRYLYEPPQPPPLDHKVEEEAVAQAAALAAGFEGRKMRRFLQRRTVDYMGSWIKYKEHRIRTSTARGDHYLKPSPHYIVNLLPAPASCSPSSSAAPHLVHTSTNKIRTPVNCLTWLPSSRRLLTGSSSGEFTLWNGLTFNFETILQACDNGVRDLRWSHSGNLLLSGDAGGTVKYFLPNMNNVLAVDAHRESIRGISFSPDDARWISGSDDATIKIFNTERGIEESTLKGHGWDVKCVQWHPFKGLIASGGKDNLVKFWDPRKGGREIGTYHGHKNTIQALEFSPSHVASAELLASASRDQTIKLYDLRMIREYMTLKAAPMDGGGSETGGVCSLSWHPCSPLLSSGLSTGVLQHHSLLPSSAPELPISTVSAAHDQSIWAMSWHPLGQILATGGNDCFTRWWQRERLEEGDLLAVKEQQDGGMTGEGLVLDGKSRRARGTWEDDEEADTSASFIPGLTGAGPIRGGGGGIALGNGSGGDREPFQRSNRPPPPPGFGLGGQEDYSRPPPPQSSYGGGFNNINAGGGGAGGSVGRDFGGGSVTHPPRATGANLGARDAGWGRSKHGGGGGGGGGGGDGDYGSQEPQMQMASGSGYAGQQQQQQPYGNQQAGGHTSVYSQQQHQQAHQTAFALPGLGYGGTALAPGVTFGGGGGGEYAGGINGGGGGEPYQQSQGQHASYQQQRQDGYGYGNGR